MIKLDMHESDIVRAMKNTTKSPIHHLVSRQFKIDVRDIDIDKDGIVIWEYDFEDYISYKYCVEDIDKVGSFIDEWQDFVDNKTWNDFQLPPITFCVEEKK
jgi:hypothetical protein